MTKNEPPDQDKRTRADSRGADNASGAEYTESLSVARDLIEAGIPVFVAKPATNNDGSWSPGGGHNGCGYWLPKGWPRTEPDLHVLDQHEPDDALGMVCGHKVDGLEHRPPQRRRRIPRSARR